ncbi:MAG: biotin carboxylase N-terminal domain-containing protein [Fimbriimonadaceae bacterium]
MKKLLVANRGEIAIRVFRTAREMGIKTVAVFSEADRRSAHTLFADEAICIGPPPPNESYLLIDRVIQAAMDTCADAIHPGYGFLSERAEFVDACMAAGIAFVGPSSSAMRKLGGKIEAKQLAVASGVPITPGFFEPGSNCEELARAAMEIGYPVMLKASAGGGGRGMRVVRDPDDFDQEFAIASDEALKGFGDGSMMVEKLVERPRHIEVQFLADSHGNVACLFERECSLQRRHQKLVEEAPSRVVNEAVWQTLRTAVASLVRNAGYEGAGTAEFIFDAVSQQPYFLEVNARLQVEHPVTEAITGIDLVRQQLLIAQGLPMESTDMPRSAINGHAIEVRIVAEDPAAGFMPSIGKILGWSEPQGPGIRVDTGYGPGAEVTRFYDSMIAKLIVHAETRGQAIQKLKHALLDFHVLGVKTNIAYILDVLEHPGFARAEFDTDWLGREFGTWAPSPVIHDEIGLISGLANEKSSAEVRQGATGAWAIADTFRVTGA